MEKSELDGLKKLSPKDRLARLKKLKESRKDEIEEISDLIKKSQSDMVEEIADEITPDAQDKNINDLFEAQGSDLERSIAGVKTEEM